MSTRQKYVAPAPKYQPTPTQRKWAEGSTLCNTPEEKIQNHFHTIQVIHDNIRDGTIKCHPSLFLTTAEHEELAHLLHGVQLRTVREQIRFEHLSVKWGALRYAHYHKKSDADAEAQHSRIYMWNALCAMTVDAPKATKIPHEARKWAHDQKNRHIVEILENMIVAALQMSANAQRARMGPRPGMPPLAPRKMPTLIRVY